VRGWLHRAGAGVLGLVFAGAAGPLAQAQVTENMETITVTAPRIAGPGVSASGSNDYGITSQQIQNMPAGENTALSDVLTQMPGISLDQNQQIHIRNTEGPQFQYQINGILVPLDINTNPPFISMLNPMFISRLDLLDGILPSRYSYATGGVVDIETKDGCSDPGGSASVEAGQRRTLQPSVQYGGCAGNLSYYLSALYDQSDTAFSSATPSPSGIHDYTNQGQAFGFFTWRLNDATKLSLITSSAGSNNQLPNVGNLAPQFVLAGAPAISSANINSYLNFRDSLAMVALNGTPSNDLSYQLAASAHYISQAFIPDNDGELIYQGVASTATHRDIDGTLEGDLTLKRGAHTLGTGFYVGLYRVLVDDSTLTFPVDAMGNQTSTTPVQLSANTQATNIVSGIYLNDLWQIDDRWKLNAGVRWDDLTGFTNNNQVDPTLNLSYLATPDTTLHGGIARYMQVPSFQGISPNASTAFAGTVAGGPPGVTNPLTEDDVEIDVGVVHHVSPQLTLSEDNFYERTHHYLDTGQFGVVPIFAPFNYDNGYIWGNEVGASFKNGGFSAYANFTYGRNLQQGVVTGQFNFDPNELAWLDSHHIALDHQPIFGLSGGATYAWREWSFSVDSIFNTGLRAGFADSMTLPDVWQVNASVERAFDVPGVGKVTDRVSVLNLFNRVNLIRPAEGIGIFQSAYGPRLTITDTVTVPF
jgi:outer membrane receptor protein involved in Fe transport